MCRWPAAALTTERTEPQTQPGETTAGCTLEFYHRGMVRPVCPLLLLTSYKVVLDRTLPVTTIDSCQFGLH